MSKPATERLAQLVLNCLGCGLLIVVIGVGSVVGLTLLGMALGG